MDAIGSFMGANLKNLPQKAHETVGCFVRIFSGIGFARLEILHSPEIKKFTMPVVKIVKYP